jgi:hypothetical protein
VSAAFDGILARPHAAAAAGVADLGAGGVLAPQGSERRSAGAAYGGEANAAAIAAEAFLAGGGRSFSCTTLLFAVAAASSTRLTEP